MRRAFICSPYRGDEIRNTIKAREICKLFTDAGILPIAPHLYFTQFLNEDVVDERNTGIAMGLELMGDCQEVWAFYDPAKGPSMGMIVEMGWAQRALNIPVKHVDITKPLRLGDVWKIDSHV